MPTATPTMSPAGQSVAAKLDALRQVQAQAEQRVKIGTQLLKAAEAHTANTRHYVEEIRGEQNDLREQLRQDMTASLHQCDQRVGTLDDNLTRRLEKLEQRLDAAQSNWQLIESRVMQLVARAEALAEQSRAIVEAVSEFGAMGDDEDEIIEARPYREKLDDRALIQDPALAPLSVAAPPPPPITSPVAPPGDDLYSRLIRDLNGG